MLSKQQRQIRKIARSKKKNLTNTRAPKPCSKVDAAKLDTEHTSSCEEVLDLTNVNELEMISKMYCDWMRTANNTYLEYYMNSPEVSLLQSYIYSFLI